LIPIVVNDKVGAKKFKYQEKDEEIMLPKKDDQVAHRYCLLIIAN